MNKTGYQHEDFVKTKPESNDEMCICVFAYGLISLNNKQTKKTKKEKILNVLQLFK